MVEPPGTSEAFVQMIKRYPFLKTLYPPAGKLPGCPDCVRPSHFGVICWKTLTNMKSAKLCLLREGVVPQPTWDGPEGSSQPQTRGGEAVLASAL